jgi:hypothetical protein
MSHISSEGRSGDLIAKKLDEGIFGMNAVLTDNIFNVLSLQGEEIMNILNRASCEKFKSWEFKLPFKKILLNFVLKN